MSQDFFFNYFQLVHTFFSGLMPTKNYLPIPIKGGDETLKPYPPLWLMVQGSSLRCLGVRGKRKKIKSQMATAPRPNPKRATASL